VSASTTPERLRFGLHPDLYDAARPAYPEKLVDDVLAYGGVVPGARTLEIGAGTGQATVQLGRRGLDILALEPSPEMAALARAKLAAAGLTVAVEAVDFESASLPAHTFALVLAATSWHWLAPRVRWERALHALAPGGTVAAFWNWPHWRRSNLRPELDAAYRRSGVKLDEIIAMRDIDMNLRTLAGEWRLDAPDAEAFTDMRIAEYRWSLRYTSRQYVALLGTYGDHIALDADVRARLFSDIVAVIEAHGGTLELPHSTLLLATRAGAVR
jgi:SAM-dependent methyltransferase